MRLTHHSRLAQDCRGMTLIEVLIAAVVIAIGLLGVAALQVTALQGSSNADYRSRATELAASLSDRMRANLEGVEDNAYISNVDADCDNPPAPICSVTPNATTTTGVAECTTDEIAVFDLWEVRCRNGVQNTLPGGQLVVDCIDNDGGDADPCSTMSPMTATITWQVQSDSAVLETQTVVSTIVPGAP
ncbi:MAG: type IV pilus modification protein PilV [Candidatus Thiodiazotropha sp.]